MSRLDDCYAQGEYGVCFWTAGQRLDPSPRSESEFVWRVLSANNDTTGLTAMSYTNWYPGQPSNYRGNEGCLLMWSGRKYKWNDQHCSRSPMWVIPLVLTARPHQQASLIAPVITRLAWVPVGVGHCGQACCIIVGRQHSPDEFRFRPRTWIQTLSCRPETDSIFPLCVAVIQSAH